MRATPQSKVPFWPLDEWTPLRCTKFGAALARLHLCNTASPCEHLVPRKCRKRANLLRGRPSREVEPTRSPVVSHVTFHVIARLVRRDENHVRKSAPKLRDELDLKLDDGIAT